MVWAMVSSCLARVRGPRSLDRDHPIVREIDVLLLLHVIGSVEPPDAPGHRKQLAFIDRVTVQPRDLAAAPVDLELEATHRRVHGGSPLDRGEKKKAGSALRLDPPRPFPFFQGGVPPGPP